MRKFSRRVSKTINIFTLVLELVSEIVLLPLKVIKTIFQISNELHR